MTPNPKTGPARVLRIGLDARLAFRRGVGTYAAQLALALAERERGLELFLLSAPPELKELLKGSKAQFRDPSPRQPALYEQTALPALARRERLDLLHYTDNTASVFWETPYVLTLHDTMMTRPLSETVDHPTFRQRFLFLYKRWAAPESARGARMVVTISKFSKDSIVRKFSVDPDRVRVVPEGVEVEAYRRPAGWPKPGAGPVRLLAQGAVDPRKNVPNILRTAQVLKRGGISFRLRIIGAPREEFERAGYVALAQKWGVANEVEWAGWVGADQLARQYWDADLFFYPSLWEGFGLPVLEAFAAGTPVVTSNGSSLPEVAGDAALLVRPDDPEAMGAGILGLLKRPARLRALAAKGIRRAKSFTWEATADLTAALYHEAAEGFR